MLRRVGAVFAVLSLVGCGTMMYVPGRPGSGVDASIAQRYGCDVTSVLAEARTTAAGLMPQLGWNACRVLATIGRPDTDRLSVVAGVAPTLTWVYRLRDVTHVLRFEGRREEKRSQWILVTVSW